MRTYKENAELFLKYSHDNGCSRTGYCSERDVELKDDGDLGLHPRDAVEIIHE